MSYSPMVNAIGTGAAFCTTVSLVPQLVRIWRLKSAREISLNMFLLFSCGVGLWLAYGFMIHALPVILANSVTLVLSMAILVLKLVYDGGGSRASSKPAHESSQPPTVASKQRAS